MNVLSQKEGVRRATHEVLAQSDQQHTNEQPILSYITKEQRNQVVELVIEGLMDGSILMVDNESNAKKKSDPKLMKSYTIGLVNNWFRKDTSLNGGDKYVTKNPGSRAGAGDEKLKTLKALKEQLAHDTDKVKAIDEAIAIRQGEIAKERLAKKAKEINLDCLDEETRKLLGV